MPEVNAPAIFLNDVNDALVGEIAMAMPLGQNCVLEGDAGVGVSTLLTAIAQRLPQPVDILQLDAAEPHDNNLVVDAILSYYGVDRQGLGGVLRENLQGTPRYIAVLVDNAEDIEPAALATMQALKNKLGDKMAYLFAGPPGVEEEITAGGLEVAKSGVVHGLSRDDIALFALQQKGLALSESQAEALFETTRGQPGELLAELLHLDKLPPVISEVDEPAPTKGDDEAPPLVDDQLTAPEQEASPVAITAESGDRPTNASGDDVPLERTDMSPEPAGTEEAPAASGDASAPPEVVRVAGPGSGRPAGRSPEASRSTENGPVSRKRLYVVVAVVAVLLLIMLLWPRGSEQETARTLPLPPPPPRAVESQPAPSSDRFETSRRTMSPVARLEDLPPRGAAAEPEPEREQSATAPRPVERVDVAPSPAPSETSASVNGGFRTADWLRQQPDGVWFLQLTATSEERAAQRVLDRLNGEGAYYAANRGGRTVYLVLAGAYPSRDAATSARESLPDEFRAAGPFPRSIEDIRSEL